MTLANRLPTTRWSLVNRAGQRLGEGQGGHGDLGVNLEVVRQSLNELCQMYWPALYGYLRHRGYERADAEDLTQGFFADLLSREAISVADENRGRFRAFLYSSLDNFVAKQERHRGAKKRGGDANTFSIDQSRCSTQDDSWIGVSLNDAGAMEPSAIFDRQWAKCLIDQTLFELRQEYSQQGKLQWFDTLAVFLTSSEVTSDQRLKIAKSLEMSSTALKVAIHRLRSRYREHLIQTVAQTVDDPEMVGSEREILFSALDAKRM